MTRWRAAALAAVLGLAALLAVVVILVALGAGAATAQPWDPAGERERTRNDAFLERKAWERERGFQAEQRRMERERQDLRLERRLDREDRQPKDGAGSRGWTRR